MTRAGEECLSLELLEVAADSFIAKLLVRLAIEMNFRFHIK